MSNEQLRRQILRDRLESIQLDAERWQYDAYNAGDIEEATRWFEFSRVVAATLTVTSSA